MILDHDRMRVYILYAYSLEELLVNFWEYQHLLKLKLIKLYLQ